MTPPRINGSAPAVKAKGKGRRLKRFLVLEVVATLEVDSFEEAQKRIKETFPEEREFLVEELKG